MMFTRNEVCIHKSIKFQLAQIGFCESLGLGPSSMIFLLLDVAVFHVLQMPILPHSIASLLGDQ